MEWHVKSLGALLLLAVAGCGGSSGSAQPAGSARAAAGSAASGSALTRSGFVLRADAICQRLNVEILKVKPKSASLREIQRFAPAHAALEQSSADELGKLNPPTSIAHEWQQIVAYRRILAEELRTLGRDAHANDVAGIRALGAAKLRVHKQLLVAGKRAGFEHCSLVG
jgi:hypothetical protein